MRPLILGLGAAVVAVHGAPAGAQRAIPDSALGDTTRRLEAVTVTVTRAESRVLRLPWAVGVQTAADVRRAQPTVSVDEALNNIPGVMVSNRHIHALDPRISVRGAGSRANFGTRGVKVLLDGVPQSLPDGQSQLTNVELGTIGRVEVLRGTASSLYGNGSGGVISFDTDMRAPARFAQSLRLTTGSYARSLRDARLTDRAFTKWQTRAVGRNDLGIGSLSVSRTTVSGYRQHSDADIRQLNAAADVFTGFSSVLQVRAHHSSVPLALNPGALTLAEWNVNPDSAAAANVARGASRTIEQSQFSAGWRRTADNGDVFRILAYALVRDVQNPLATPPPGQAAANNGTLVGIDRTFVGARVDAQRTIGEAGASAPRVTAGLDVQRMRDHRRNWRSTAGTRALPADTLLLDQTEVVSSLGPFALVSWAPSPAWQTSAGVRWDRTTFSVHDRFLRDGDNDSGERTMGAASGHLGASYAVSSRFVPYANVATAFETPTTTELNARPDGTGGFNDVLDPQRIASVEFGARGRVFEHVQYDVSAFVSRASDAIIQFQEVQGRAYFRNAGRTTSRGVELGVEARVSPRIDARLSYTHAHYVFGDYRIARVGAVDTLDGNRMAGVPEQFVRAGLRGRLARATLDADWTWSDALWADDLNTLRINDWGRGRLDLRLAWIVRVAGNDISPFFAVNNAFDQRYVGSITLNGAFGRVREGAPGRSWYAGFDVNWSVLR